MALQPGTKVGSYTLSREIGRGGMGEVYLARDENLDRSVALKVLPPEVSRDPERVLRFEREAKLLASLNHSNIAAVHGFDEHEGSRFLVMEYVDGETLAEMLKRGPLPIDEAIDIARQMATGLEAAHDAGVIHRDLKPGNVMVTKDGTVKLLDFGLAKAASSDPASSPSALAESPTITADYTRPGVVLGTAAYMSPEQARGKHVDKRTDVWSFGCVLFECLGGRRPFGGETTTDLIAQILEREPDWHSLPPATPPAVKLLVQRCLAKDKRKRLRDIGDVLVLLEGDTSLSTFVDVSQFQSDSRSPSVAARVMVGALLLLVGVFAGSWLIAPNSPIANGPGNFLRSDRAERDPVAVSIAIPEKVWPGTCEISPDGTYVVCRAEKTVGEERYDEVMIRDLSDRAFRPLRGLERCSGFRISPDSKWIAGVVSDPARNDRRVLRRVLVDGSAPPQAVFDIPPEWLNEFRSTTFSWPATDTFLFTDEGDRLHFVDANTGSTTGTIKPKLPIAAATLGATVSDESLERLYTEIFYYPGGRFCQSTLVTTRDGSDARLLFARGSTISFPARDIIAFTRGPTLYASRIDAKSGTLVGSPLAVLDGLRTDAAWEDGEYTCSKDGTLLYVPGGRVGGQRHLAVISESGEITKLAHPPRAYDTWIEASLDGRLGAVILVNADDLFEIWIADLESSGLRRFCQESDADCMAPSFSPNADKLAYVLEGRGERDGVYLAPLDGSHPPRCIARAADSQAGHFVHSWTPDGSHVIVSVQDEGDGKLYLVPVDGSRAEDALRSEPWLGQSFRVFGADLSPDGKLLTYSSTQVGRMEVFVARVDDGKVAGNAVQLTTQGGHWPHWVPEGDAILYFRDGRLRRMDVAVEGSARMTSDRAVIDFAETDLLDDNLVPLPGGKVLALHAGPDEKPATHVNVVFNWAAELERRLPAAE